MIVDLKNLIQSLRGAIDDLDPQGNNSYVSNHTMLLASAEKLHADAVLALSEAIIGVDLAEILTLLKQVSSLLTDIDAIEKISIPQELYEAENKTILQWEEYVELEKKSHDIIELAGSMANYIERMFCYTVYHLLKIDNNFEITTLQDNLKSVHNGKEIFGLITNVLERLDKDIVFLMDRVKLYEEYVEPIAKQYKQQVNKFPLHTFHRNPPAFSLTDGLCMGDAIFVSGNVESLFEFKVKEAFELHTKYEDEIMKHCLYDNVKFVLNITHHDIADFIYSLINGHDINGHPALVAGIETDAALQAFARKAVSNRSCKLSLSDPEEHVLTIVQSSENGIPKIYLRDLNSGVYDVSEPDNLRALVNIIIPSYNVSSIAVEVSLNPEIANSIRREFEKNTINELVSMLFAEDTDEENSEDAAEENSEDTDEKNLASIFLAHIDFNKLNLKDSVLIYCVLVIFAMSSREIYENTYAKVKIKIPQEFLNIIENTSFIKTALLLLQLFMELWNDANIATLHSLCQSYNAEIKKIPPTTQESLDKKYTQLQTIRANVDCVKLEPIKTKPGVKPDLKELFSAYSQMKAYILLVFLEPEYIKRVRDSKLSVLSETTAPSVKLKCNG